MPLQKRSFAQKNHTHGKSMTYFLRKPIAKSHSMAIGLRKRLVYQLSLKGPAGTLSLNLSRTEILLSVNVSTNCCLQAVVS